MFLTSRLRSWIAHWGSRRLPRLNQPRLELELLEERQLLANGVPTPAHVVIVIEENHSFNEIIGNSQAPYINSLANGPNSALFTQSFAVEHPSQPNYLDLFSGSNQGVTSDNVPSGLPFTTANLGAELLAAGKTFVGYSEDLPSVGFTGASSGNYASKHNPWVDWQGTGPNGIPAVDNQPLTSFPTNFANLPTVSIVVPNQDDDMHSGSIATGDAWLQQNLSSYIQWAKSNNSLFILTFDEDDSSMANQIPTLFVGSMVQSGQYSEHITHFNVLRMIEDMYGLPYAGQSATATPITDVWTGAVPPANNPPPTVATPASASPNVVTGLTTALSVLGADASGAASLSYTWSVVAMPSGAAAPTFSANGTNAAQNVTATFSQAGNYTLRATITDASDLSVTSDVSVTVTQTATSLTVSPANVSVADGGTQQFAATVKDQFGQALAVQPAVAWSLAGGSVGALSPSGLYTAPATGSGTATVQAVSGSLSARATATVTAVTPPPVGTGGNVDVSFTVSSDWGSGFTASMSIKNNGVTAIAGWQLAFDFPVSITSIWNARIVSHTGNHYVIEDAGYNSAIAPGATVSFGFNGSPGHLTTQPANEVFNGVPVGQAPGPIVPPPPPPVTTGGVAVSFAVTSDWGSGFTANMTLQNNQTTAVNGWTLEVDAAFTISSIWNAVIVSHVGNQYVIQSASWNGTIGPDGTVTFGFQAAPRHVTTGPTNVLVNGTAVGS